MGKNTKTLITLAKLIIVVSLLVYVCLKIQWRDSLVLNLDLESESMVQGQILSQWNKYPVEFQADDGTKLVVNEPDSLNKQQLNPGFFTYLKQTDPFWLVMAAVAFITIFMFSAVRWHWLVNSQNLNLDLSQAIRLTWIGIFFNNFVPGQTGGDLIKAYYIAKNSPQKRLTAVLTVIADRIIGLTALIMISLFTVTLFFDRFKEIAYTLWLGLFLGLLCAVILLKRSVRRKLGLSSLVKKLPDKITNAIYQLDTAIRQYEHHKRGILLWWALSILNHCINMFGVYALSRSIDMGVPAIEIFALVPVIFIVSALPIAPNGWGIGEALFGSLFGQYGASYLPDAANAEKIMSTRGVALSILFRLMNMVLSLAGGLLLLFSKEKLPSTEQKLDQSKIV